MEIGIHCHMFDMMCDGASTSAEVCTGLKAAQLKSLLQPLPSLPLHPFSPHPSPAPARLWTCLSWVCLSFSSCFQLAMSVFRACHSPGCLFAIHSHFALLSPTYLPGLSSDFPLLQGVFLDLHDGLSSRVPPKHTCVLLPQPGSPRTGYSLSTW